MTQLRLLLLLLFIASVGYAQQLRFTGSGFLIPSERVAYDSSKTFTSQIIPLGEADTVWGNFFFGDTVDVDIYIRHIRFNGTPLFSDTTARLDSLRVIAVNGGVKKITHAVGAYRGWEGYQWILQFQSFNIAPFGNTKSERYFMGNGLNK